MVKKEIFKLSFGFVFFLVIFFIVCFFSGPSFDSERESSNIFHVMVI